MFLLCFIFENEAPPFFCLFCEMFADLRNSDSCFVFCFVKLLVDLLHSFLLILWNVCRSVTFPYFFVCMIVWQMRAIHLFFVVVFSMLKCVHIIAIHLFCS